MVAEMFWEEYLYHAKIVQKMLWFWQPMASMKDEEEDASQSASSPVSKDPEPMDRDALRATALKSMHEQQGRA